MRNERMRQILDNCDKIRERHRNAERTAIIRQQMIDAEVQREKDRIKSFTSNYTSSV